MTKPNLRALIGTCRFWEAQDTRASDKHSPNDVLRIYKQTWEGLPHGNEKMELPRDVKLAYDKLCELSPGIAQQYDKTSCCPLYIFLHCITLLRLSAPEEMQPDRAPLEVEPNNV